MATFGPTDTDDDGDETSTSTWTDENYNIGVGKSGATITQGGWRWTDVTVDQGSTITVATITFEVNNRDSALSTDAQIFGDDVDDAAAWGSSSRPSSGFTKTTEKVVFNAPGTGSYAVTITAIVQEIVNRAGWNKLDMRFAAFDYQTDFGQIHTVDAATGGTTPAVLDITYVAAAGHPPLQPHRGQATHRASFF